MQERQEREMQERPQLGSDDDNVYRIDKLMNQILSPPELQEIDSPSICTGCGYQILPKKIICLTDYTFGAIPFNIINYYTPDGISCYGESGFYRFCKKCISRIRELKDVKRK